MAKTPKVSEKIQPAGPSAQPAPPAPLPSETKGAAPEPSTSSASSTGTVKKPVGKGLAGLAKMHSDERPVADNNVPPRPGRPPKTDEEKEATRLAYEAKRKEARAKGILKAEKKAEKPAMTDAEKKSRIQVNATMMATTTIGIFAGIFGEKFKNGATGNDDQEILESGWISYFTAKDIVEIPPLLALLLSHTTYLLPRISFKAIWEKFFPEKEGQVIEHVPKTSPQAAPPKGADILLYQEAKDHSKVESGAPQAGV